MPEAGGSDVSLSQVHLVYILCQWERLAPVLAVFSDRDRLNRPRKITIPAVALSIVDRPAGLTMTLKALSTPPVPSVFVPPASAFLDV